MRPPADMCVMCKGSRRMCGQSFCPILKRMDIQLGFKRAMKPEAFGPSQEVFVGSFGYPNISFGPLAAIDRKPLLVKELYGRPYQDIIDMRVSMVRGKRYGSTTARMERDMQEVALSIRPTDIEMNFSKVPDMKVTFSSLVQPMGPSAPLTVFRQAGNPSIPRRVDSVMNDDLLAVEAISELTTHGLDSYYLTNIFATGALGKEQNRKIVPTRWSITAVDDIIAKQRMERLRVSSQISDILVFSHGDYDNHYEVLLMPGNWEFENFEAWSPKSIWAQGAQHTVVTEEHEPFEGRTKYADRQVGGYYASRFSVVQYLHSIRKQARAVVFREIGSGYMVPLGVFQVREGVRSALGKPPSRFDSLGEALADIRTRLNTPLSEYLRQSRVLAQSRLTSFF